jgi:hypothetical protein
MKTILWAIPMTRGTWRPCPPTLPTRRLPLCGGRKGVVELDK